MDDDPWADAHTPQRSGTPADGAGGSPVASGSAVTSPLSAGKLASPRHSDDAGAVLARLSLDAREAPEDVNAADAWANTDHPASPSSPSSPTATAEPLSDAPEPVASPPPEPAVESDNGADAAFSQPEASTVPAPHTESSDDRGAEDAPPAVAGADASDAASAPAPEPAAEPAPTAPIDDDFGDDFAEPPEATTSAAAAAADDGFDDFDDFDAPAAAGDFDDEGFGDFGDFADVDETAEPEAAARAPPAPAPAEPQWATLNLRPVPPRVELMERVSGMLAALVPDPASFTDEQPRSVGGLGQVLTSESSRDAYAQLTTAPMLKPLDWTRSRVRREHLIAMGVPVNLDEVDSHRLSALPPLLIKTGDVPLRTQSADPARAPQRASSLAPPAAGASASAAGPASAPVSTRNSENDKYGLGPRPRLDMPIAEELCGLEEEKLSLMPLSKLESIQRALVDSTADASALLAYLLQLKDALGADSATYNGMISEMIANAAKQKQPSSGGGLFRRGGSRPTSMSASNTPGRVASPSVPGAR